jgi:flagellar hook-associated protein 1 FlgK
MSSSFSGLSSALSALTAQRRGLDVAAQNIANANTDGYTRQRVDLKATGGTAVPAVHSISDGTSGGVAVSDVARLRDAFLDARAVTEHGENTYLASEAQVHGQIEALFGEPGDTGLQAQLGDLWAAWHDVANTPGDLAARSALLGQATTAATTLNLDFHALTDLWSAKRTQLDELAEDVNTSAARVGELNIAIVRARQADQPANQLQDQRDQLTLHLAELTGATVAERDDGGVNVFVGGSTLVSGTSVRQVRTVGADDLSTQAGDPPGLRWTDSNTAVAVPNGQIASVIGTLGATIPKYAAALDNVAKTLADAVNIQHAAGYDLAGTAGGQFFSGTTAATVQVAITDPHKVAASSTASATGGNLDGGNADAIAAIANQANGADNYYQQLVADLGASTSTANQRASIQSSLTDAADAAVAAQSGVSLDEEMTNMLTYQRGYEAAARVMSTVDSTLDTLINRTI